MALSAGVSGYSMPTFLDPAQQPAVRVSVPVTPLSDVQFSSTRGPPVHATRRLPGLPPPGVAHAALFPMRTVIRREDTATAAAGCAALALALPATLVSLTSAAVCAPLVRDVTDPSKQQPWLAVRGPAAAPSDDELLRRARRQDFLAHIVQHSINFTAHHRAYRAMARSLGDAIARRVRATERGREKEGEREERARLKALRSNDMAAYAALVANAKNSRLAFLLEQTEAYLRNLSSLISAQQSENAKQDGEARQRAAAADAAAAVKVEAAKARHDAAVARRAAKAAATAEARTARQTAKNSARDAKAAAKAAASKRGGGSASAASELHPPAEADVSPAQHSELDSAAPLPPADGDSEMGVAPSVAALGAQTASGVSDSGADVVMADADADDDIGMSGAATSTAAAAAASRAPSVRHSSGAAADDNSVEGYRDDEEGADSGGSSSDDEGSSVVDDESDSGSSAGPSGKAAGTASGDGTQTDVMAAYYRAAHSTSERIS